jgi:flagellar biosynthesis/type III secretory pathway chaperone
MTGEKSTSGWEARCAILCAELIAVMQEQGQLCDGLLELTRKERSSILESRVDLLEWVTQKKGELIGEMDRLEQKRRAIAAELARRLDLDGDPSLPVLAGRVGGDEATELLDAGRRVSQAVARLKDANESNLRLMSKSLEVVRDSLRQLRRITGGGSGYTWTGRPRPAGGTLVVDCRA